jgi:hypothetical protein
MDEMIYGFYAFAFYSYDNTLAVLTGPHRAYLWVIFTPQALACCILIANRLISAFQLVLLVLATSLSPLLLHLIMLGSGTLAQFSFVAPRPFELLATGTGLVFASLLLTLYVGSNFFFIRKWEIKTQRSVGLFLSIAVLLLSVPGSSVLFGLLSMRPGHTYTADTAYQWCGELTANIYILFLFTITIPAIFGVASDYLPSRLSKIIFTLLMLGLSIHSLIWSVDYLMNQLSLFL